MKDSGVGWVGDPRHISHDELGIATTIVSDGTSQAAKPRLGEIAQLITSTHKSCCRAVTVSASEVGRGSKGKDG